MSRGLMTPGREPPCLHENRPPRPLASGKVEADYTPRQVAELLEAGDIQLVDVRAPHEYEAGRIAGADHIELAELSSRADELDRDRPVVFYCRSGSRSGMATEAFRGAGYDAHNMAGGLLEWHADGLPIEPSDGRVAES